MLKKIFILLSVCAAGLASCSKWGSETPTTPVLQTKYISSITDGNGNSINFEYDLSNRVSRLTYTDDEGAHQYDISYDIKTIEVSSGSEKRVMRFNGYGALESWSSVIDGEERKLSMFSYVTENASYLYLSGITNLETRGETSIYWSSFSPSRQTNRWIDDSEGVSTIYSTAVDYVYETFVSNVHTNVNLFLLLIPEYFENASMDRVLAAAVSVYGTRMYYLPTKVTVLKNRNYMGETSTISNEERRFSYDCDTNGYVQRIYSGVEGNKTLLYSINYFTQTE